MLWKYAAIFTGEYPCQSVISITLLCNSIEITLRRGCSPLNLLHIFSRRPFVRTLLEGYFWIQLWYMKFTEEPLLRKAQGNRLNETDTENRRLENDWRKSPCVIKFFPLKTLCKIFLTIVLDYTTLYTRSTAQIITWKKHALGTTLRLRVACNI